jgi:hypothetical protein
VLALTEDASQAEILMRETLKLYATEHKRQSDRFGADPSWKDFSM